MSDEFHLRRAQARERAVFKAALDTGVAALATVPLHDQVAAHAGMHVGGFHFSLNFGKSTRIIKFVNVTFIFFRLPWNSAQGLANATWEAPRGYLDWRSSGRVRP
jgi:hypothetical protein